MEYALREQRRVLKARLFLVLILVLMEYALRVLMVIIPGITTVCLNPCSNGICSARLSTTNVTDFMEVLILVLMEYALRGTRVTVDEAAQKS